MTTQKKKRLFQSVFFIIPSLILLSFASVRLSTLRLAKAHELQKGTVLSFESERPKKSRFENYKIPEGFPSDFPLLSKNIVNTWKVSEAMVDGYTLIIEEENGASLVDFYSTALANNGWSVDKRGETLTFFKGAINGYIDVGKESRLMLFIPKTYEN